MKPGYSITHNPEDRQLGKDGINEVHIHNFNELNNVMITYFYKGVIPSITEIGCVAIIRMKNKNK